MSEGSISDLSPAHTASDPDLQPFRTPDSCSQAFPSMLSPCDLHSHIPTDSTKTTLLVAGDAPSNTFCSTK